MDEKIDKIDDGGQVFPIASDAPYWPGMTLRDYFAGQAMLTAALSLGDDGRPAIDPPPSFVAVRAYMLADAMIAARKGDSDGN